MKIEKCDRCKESFEETYYFWNYEKQEWEELCEKCLDNLSEEESYEAGWKGETNLGDEI